jgi:hypothetical protein
MWQVQDRTEMQTGSWWRKPNIKTLLGRSRGRDSSVGIVTRYGLEVWGSNPGGGGRFSAPVQTGNVDHPNSYTMGTGSFPG